MVFKKVYFNKLFTIALSLLMLLTNFNIYNVKAEDDNDENITVASNNTSYYIGEFIPTFEHSTVAWYAWKSGDDLSSVTKDDLHIIENSGDTVTLEQYNTSDKCGYMVFFVKPEDNYMFTGINADGNGDYYIVGSGNYGNISWVNSNVVKAAEDAGYIGMFGYSCQGSSKTGVKFSIIAQSPDMKISAVPNKANDVVEGEEITFTVTITPVKTESKKDEITSVVINSITINGNEVDASNIGKLEKQSDGTYLSTLTYVATKEDCEKKTIELKVNGTVGYKASASMNSGATSITTATITKEATATCDIAKKAQVTYKFESATKGKDLPLEVYNLRPEDTDSYVVNTTVTAKDVPTTRVDVDNDNEHGYWTFKGWDKTSKTMTEDGITFTGKWEWKKKSGKVGYYLTLGNASWNIPDGISQTSNNKLKYYYDKQFAKYDIFTVTDNKPSADGYAFIGWLDKERGNKSALIVHGGVELTYLYDNDTYTLDALWANISVGNTTTKYDGNAYTIGDVDVAINQGTTLKEEYAKQAKALITEDKTSIRYSIDGKTWMETKPTFTDAGTYTVYVKENIQLGGETVVINGQGTVTIEKRNVTLTSESASKIYDGTVLTRPTVTVSGDDFVDGEVSDIKANGTITNVGSVDNTIFYTTSSKFNSNNYNITESIGKLEIKAQSINPSDVENYKGIIVGNLDDVTYNGLDQKQEPIVTDKNDVPLTKDVDYTISFSEDTKNVGAVTVTITGIKNYVGVVTRTYKINTAKLTIYTNSAKREYTGEALTAGVKEIKGLVNEETLSINTTGTITNYGKTDNTYVIDWDNSTAKESNYNIESVLGKLEILKKDVTITSGSASKVYDKTALTNSEVNAIGFVDGEGALYSVTGSQTNVGESDNIFTYTLKENTLADNYNITIQYGKLTVTNAEDVVVTIKGNTLETTYDGENHEVSGYTYTITEGSTYTVDDFKFIKKDATISGKDAGVYNLGLKADQFENLNSNYKVTFIIENDTTLNIKKREVTLTSASDKREYNGSALAKNEVYVSEGSFVEGEGYSYQTSGKQLIVGSSKNEFTYSLNDGTKANNYNIKTENGLLTITPLSKEIVVNIKGNSDTFKYDGQNHSVFGYVVTSINNNLYSENDFKYEGSTVVSGKNADTYYIGLDVKKFENTNQNFSNVQFVVEDGTLTISRRELTLTSENDSKVYDGTPLTNSTVTVSGDGFADKEGAIYDVTGSITDFGSRKNSFTYDLYSNTLESNYEITKIEGNLSITKVDEVVVTIKGHSDNYLYDGNEKLVSGYDVKITTGSLYKESDFSFNGNLEVKATAAGTYYMGLSEDDFTNNNENFDKVTFVVEDGSLNIAKRSVKLSSGSDSKVYDGTALTKPEVTVSGDGFVKGEANAIATGSITDKGDVINSIEIVNKNSSYNENNYDIEIVKEGTLTINKAPLTIITYSDKKTYDGTALVGDGKIEGLVDGEKATLIVTSSRTDFGQSDNNSYTINWDSAKESNYKIVNESFGKLTVIKKTITVITESASKDYDGEPLTAGGSVTGLVNDETLSFTTTGRQTSVGSSTNSYSLTWDGTAKKDNYEVEEKLGTLTVNEKANPIPDKKDDVTPTPSPTPTPNVRPTPVRPTPSDITPTPSPSSDTSEDKKEDSSIIVNPSDDSNDDSNNETEKITIDDNVTPEWATKDKHWALINLICAVISMLLGIFLLMSKNEKEEDEEENKNLELENEEENTTQVRHRRWKVVVVIDALLSIILFILTENMTNPMVLVDRWTLLMFVLTLINVVAVIFGRKFHKEEQEEKA